MAGLSASAKQSLNERLTVHSATFGPLWRAGHGMTVKALFFNPLDLGGRRKGNAAQVFPCGPWSLGIILPVLRFELGDSMTRKTGKEAPMLPTIKPDLLERLSAKAEQLSTAPEPSPCAVSSSKPQKKRRYSGLDRFPAIIRPSRPSTSSYTIG